MKHDTLRQRLIARVSPADCTVSGAGRILELEEIPVIGDHYDSGIRIFSNCRTDGDPAEGTCLTSDIGCTACTLTTPTNEQIDGWTDGRKDGWTKGWVDGRMGGQKNGWTEGWVDGRSSG